MSLVSTIRSFFAWYSKYQYDGLVRLITLLVFVIGCILWFVIDAILMGNIDKWVGAMRGALLVV